MPGTGTRTFIDPDRYEAGLYLARIAASITPLSAFRARLTWAELCHVLILRGEEELPRIGYLRLPPQLVLSLLRTRVRCRCGAARGCRRAASCCIGVANGFIRQSPDQRVGACWQSTANGCCGPHNRCLVVRWFCRHTPYCCCPQCTEPGSCGACTRKSAASRKPSLKFSLTGKSRTLSNKG